MKSLHITLDLETASLKSNAAIIQIAAIAWDIDAKTMKKQPLLYDKHDDPFIFNAYSDLRTCIVNGLDFDPETIKWWSTQSKEAKAALVDSSFTLEPIEDLISDFYSWIREVKAFFHADEVIIWSQGTDSDISILRTVSQILGIKELPWEYNNVRDCRTFRNSMCEILGLDIYSDIFKMPQDNKLCVNITTHNALYDALQSTWNVFTIRQWLKDYNHINK